MRRTESIEDYLKAIYELQGASADGAVATSAVAERLGISSASVTGMLKRLHEAGLVEHQKYGGVRLGPAGEKVALEVIRHHRLIETYLAEAMGLPWDKVHEEAHRLEHHISDELEDRMAELLGNPLRDPHGALIPPKEGPFAEPVYRRLAEVTAGERVVIRQVDDEDAGRLRYLDELGLRPDVVLDVVAVAPYAGPITLAVIGNSVDRREVAVGRPLAETISVAAA